jgi:hypothetical protein
MDDNFGLFSHLDDNFEMTNSLTFSGGEPLDLFSEFMDGPTNEVSDHFFRSLINII